MARTLALFEGNFIQKHSRRGSVRDGLNGSKMHGHGRGESKILSIALGFILSGFGGGVVTSLCKSISNAPSTNTGGTQPYTLLQDGQKCL